MKRSLRRIFLTPADKIVEQLVLPMAIKAAFDPLCLTPEAFGKLFQAIFAKTWVDPEEIKY